MESAGDDAPADITSEPEAEVAADFEKIDSVVTDDPQRHHDLAASRPERSVVLRVDQSTEHLTSPGLAVLGPQNHAMRPGTERLVRSGLVTRARRNQGLEFISLHLRYHLRSMNYRSTIFIDIEGRLPEPKSILGSCLQHESRVFRAMATVSRATI